MEQAHSAIDVAKEAEDFQSIGVRCREILTTFICELEERKHVNPELLKEAKRGDVKERIGIISKISPREKICKHLERSSASTWELVGWLTHEKNATRSDAEYTLEATQQVLLNTLMVINNAGKKVENRCPKCKSYCVIQDFRKELIGKRENPYVQLCETCLWEEGDVS